MIRYVDLAAQNRPLLEKLRQVMAETVDGGGMILGRQTRIFEERLSALSGTRRAVGVNSGFDALALSLEALGIGPGCEVITAPNSFIASAAAIANTGAKPVFVDVDDSFNMDPEKLDAAITPRTRAVMPVHLHGRPAKIKAIREIADEYGMPVVEDCAQAIGASVDGQPVGSFGVAGCFSMHPLKNLGAMGDAGAVVTNDEGVYGKLALLRNHGLSDRDTCQLWGVNSRIDELHAAFLNVKMDMLAQWTNRKLEIAARYMEGLEGLPLVLPSEGEGEQSVFSSFVIMVEGRDVFRQWMFDHGVECLIYYPTPLHLQPAAKRLGYSRGSFPVCEAQAEKILSLPSRPELSNDEVDKVIKTIHTYFKELG